jgi:putative restriction endonuclease
MTRAELLKLFSQFAVWKSGEQRAPHKPLLILYALGCFARGETSVPFKDAHKPLGRLLREFGPPRKAHHPEYPFWRLQNDGLWEVATSTSPKLGADGAPTKNELIKVNATGRFPSSIQSALGVSPEAIPAIALQILNAHFPDSYHSAIADEIGLEIVVSSTDGVRDPNFRKKVLVSYEYRCAICDFQMLLSGIPIGLEAAHIKWHQASGPCVGSNGICMCPLHHRLFDLGAFTIDKSLLILFSEESVGTTDQGKQHQTTHGQKMRLPVHAADRPGIPFLEWHWSEVFRGKARPVLGVV